LSIRPPVMRFDISHAIDAVKRPSIDIFRTSKLYK
jgi:hypothetical protein